MKKEKKEQAEKTDGKIAEKPAEPTRDDILRKAQEIEQKDLAMSREEFVAGYNKLVTKTGFSIVSVPKLVSAGAGLFAVGSDLVVQPVPPKGNGNGRG